MLGDPCSHVVAERLANLGQGAGEPTDAPRRRSHVVEVFAVAECLLYVQLVHSSTTAEHEFAPEVGVVGDGADGTGEQ